MSFFLTAQEVALHETTALSTHIVHCVVGAQHGTQYYLQLFIELITTNTTQKCVWFDHLNGQGVAGLKYVTCGGAGADLNRHS